MTDLDLHWSPSAFGADLSLTGPALDSDDGLVSAVILSLFSDARARSDDALPQDGADRRGWWGDALDAQSAGGDGREIGSRLWLYGRSKALPSVLQDVRQAANEALSWLIETGVATAVTVEAERQRSGATDILALGVTIARPSGPMRLKFDAAWSATAAQLRAGTLGNQSV